MVLWDFGLVIDFPPASTILIPSALIVHSNTPVPDDKTRYSLVQYAAGGLFRWVEHGHMTRDHYLSSLLSEVVDSQENGGRWANSVNMFTRISDFDRPA